MENIMVGFDKEAAEYILNSLREDGAELDYALMEQTLPLAMEGELAYLEKEGMLKDGELLEGEYDEDAAFEMLRTALCYRDQHVSRGGSSVAKARAYLSQHFAEPNLMLQDVARAACMSNSRLSTVFAQETGYTFTEYLTALRIGKAKELLRLGGMRSSQVAFAVGYNDPHYFSYLFKKTVGMTPSEYRRENENQPE